MTQFEAFSGEEAVASHEVLMVSRQIVAFNFNAPLVEENRVLRFALAAGNDSKIQVNGAYNFVTNRLRGVV